MKILVFNVGSSSVKYSLFVDGKRIAKKNFQKTSTKKDRLAVVKKILKQVGNVDKIGHRIVHGGENTKPIRLDKREIAKLEKISELAPLHNIPELDVVKLCLAHAKNYAVFDTAFFSGMPEVAKRYAIPAKYKEIKRYGFHGTSHKFVSTGIKGKVITCHLGNGASVSAIKNGRALDTSMGFTPLEGLVMGTRCGDIDAGVIEYLMSKYKLSIKQVMNILNKESGLKGLSGNADMKNLLFKRNFAKELFVYRAAKKIGSYIPVLGGLDTLIFTAGIGENEWQIRELICDYFEFMGCKIDRAKNEVDARVVSKKNSKIKVLVIPTDEELMIAKQITRL